MKKSKSKENLLALVEEKATVIQIKIRKPYVFVEVKARISDQDICGIGFAKVAYPDVWDPKAGIQVARKRACADVTKQVALYRRLQNLEKPVPDSA